MNKFLISLITAIVILGGIILYIDLTSSHLCTYKIPNSIKFECPTLDNSTRLVNSFEITLFEYDNAISQNCTVNQTDDSHGFRYEQNECNLDIPFEKV